MTHVSTKNKIRRKNIRGNKLINPVAEIADLHREISNHLESAVQKAIRIGELLTAQKNVLEHGQFSNWIEQNCPFKVRTAQRYMRIFRQGGLSVKNDIVSHLPPDDSEEIEELCIQIEAIRNEELPRLDIETASDDDLIAHSRLLVGVGHRTVELRRKLLACRLPSGRTIGEALGVDDVA